jgi:hypothetical protein
MFRELARSRARTANLPAWLALVVTAAAFSMVEAQEASPEDRLRDLHKSYQSRRDRRNPIWLQFAIVKSETPFWVSTFRKATVDGKTKVNGDVIWRLECELAMKGEYYHSSAKGQDPLRAGRPINDFTIYNKQFTLGTTDAPNAYQLVRRVEHVQHGQWPWSISGEEVLLQLLELWVNGQMPLKSLEWKPGDKGIVELSLTSKKPGWKYTYSLDPAMDYSIVSSASYTAAGEYIDRAEVQKNESFSGITIPTRGKALHYAEGNKLGYTTEFSVTLCKTAAGDIPSRLFEYEFPDEAVVYDMDKKITVRNTAATQRDWDDIVSLVGPRRTKWWVWMAIGAGLVVATVMVVVTKRRYGGGA